jgi:hypothetical protein
MFKTNKLIKYFTLFNFSDFNLLYVYIIMRLRFICVIVPHQI